MADEKRPKTTDELNEQLGPGVVVTPGYEIPERVPARPMASDRRIFADGTVEEVEILSTYNKQSPSVAVAQPRPQTQPERK